MSYAKLGVTQVSPHHGDLTEVTIINDGDDILFFVNPHRLLLLDPRYIRPPANPSLRETYTIVLEESPLYLALDVHYIVSYELNSMERQALSYPVAYTQDTIDKLVAEGYRGVQAFYGPQDSRYEMLVGRFLNSYGIVEEISTLVLTLRQQGVINDVERHVINERINTLLRESVGLGFPVKLSMLPRVF